MLGRNSISKVVGMFHLLFHWIAYYSFLFFNLMSNVSISYYKEDTTKEDKNAFYHASDPNYSSETPFQLTVVFSTSFWFRQINWILCAACYYILQCHTGT